MPASTPTAAAPVAAALLHDPLTGLLSRAAVLDALARALSLADRLRHPVTVLFVEIDGFGQRPAGASATDRLEQAVARRLAARMRTHEVLGHWARGQFLAVLPDADVASALVLAEDLHELAPGAPGGPSVSIGVHGRAPSPTAPLHDLTADLVVAAQRALEATVADGPGRIEIEP
ncbi:diguanylate cyclase domain-containing protein [Aquabacterium sp. A08]|uniref:diguanylate cyclase domain-containing protein n=1 Tax=Aquabacterium sp. A08 TaxID=2718532 RepID=UPI00142227D3|nr:diguanylate cyclase [Aquabacterium sp. A08]NIC41562.1 diguanylate cyclase [Aquabacterium sp. A08]